MNPRDSKKPWLIVVKPGKARSTYWIQSPNGGYIQLPKAEVLHAIEVESAVFYRPSGSALARIEHLLTGKIED